MTFGLVLVFLFSLLSHLSFQSKEGGGASLFDADGCSEDWYVTGYFTPVESEYSGPTQSIQIISNDQLENRSHVKAFLDAVKVEGWGKTLQGDYIHLDPSDNKWHSSQFDKDALNNELIKGKTVAVDNDIIAFGVKISIPTLITPWNSFTYVALDVGGSVKGKHVDVFVGEGKNAEEETFKITKDDSIVCKV